MSNTLKKISKKYNLSYFIPLEERPEEFGGSLIVKVNIKSDLVFEILEFFYGEYKDLNSNFLFIDNKSSWERYFKTKNGLFRIYDYKGGLSIGSCGNFSLDDDLPKEIKKDALKFKSKLEKLEKDFIKNKRKILSEMIKENPLLNFTQTFVAVESLIEKAKIKKSLIELFVLNFAFIDAQLRYGLILEEQIRENKKDYNLKLIHQLSEKDYYNEAYIFRNAKKRKIISRKDYKLLDKLYKIRNKAVHRYFISDFEYFDLEEVIKQFDHLKKVIGNKLLKLEEYQVKKGVGIIEKKHQELSDDTVRNILKSEIRRIDSKKVAAIIPKRKRLFGDDLD